MDMAGVNGVILALNSGSSSLKFAVFERGSDDESLILEGSAEGIGHDNGSLSAQDSKGNVLVKKEHVLESQQQALEALVETLQQHVTEPLIAVGHRIVHGGPHLREHQRLTPEVLEKLEAAVHFAPLHIPQALKIVKQAQKAFPDIAHYGCFDTAFHSTLPEVAAHLPLPSRYFERGVMRYGFHGLSYESLVHRLGAELPARAVFAHLGSGASVTAVENGKSVDTSMGLTPTGGVPMGTRTGDLDPGVLLYILRDEKVSTDELEDFVNHECGLAGFTDGVSDMQKLTSEAAAGDRASELAVNAFCMAVRKYIGAYAAVLRGIDLLVFTGGIGEHSETVRGRICAGLEFLGNKVLVMKAEEERQMARHCRRLKAA